MIFWIVVPICNGIAALRSQSITEVDSEQKNVFEAHKKGKLQTYVGNHVPAVNERVRIVGKTGEVFPAQHLAGIENRFPIGAPGVFPISANEFDKAFQLPDFVE